MAPRVKVKGYYRSYPSKLKYYKIIFDSKGFGKGIGNTFRTTSKKEAIRLHKHSHITGPIKSIKTISDAEFKRTSAMIDRKLKAGLKKKR